MDGIHPLRAFRDRHNPPLSQTDLAALLDVTRETIWRWEAGERQINKERLALIAERTGIDPADLRPDLANLFKQPEAAE